MNTNQTPCADGAKAQDIRAKNIELIKAGSDRAVVKMAIIRLADAFIARHLNECAPCRAAFGIVTH